MRGRCVSGCRARGRTIRSVRPISPAVGRSSSTGGRSRWRPRCWRWNDRPAHVQRLKELLGLVTCTTTARFRRVEGGTELRLGMAYRVAGGPIGRVFDSRVGNEMVTTNRRDLARLKALAEEQTGIR